MQLLGVTSVAELTPTAYGCALRSLPPDLRVLGCGMDVVEIVPSFEEYAFTFGGVAPLRRITPGTALRLWSDDAFCGALRSVKDLSTEKVDLRFVNPQTGPFYVEGAEPGTPWRAALRARWNRPATGAPPRRSRSSAG